MPQSADPQTRKTVRRRHRNPGHALTAFCASRLFRLHRPAEGSHAVRAAVLHQTGQDELEVHDDIEAVGFGPGKVRIRVRATGLCHSDPSAKSGVLPQPAPFVPGHEGAGEIAEVGEGWPGSRRGDRAVVCRLPPCRACPACRRGQSEPCLAGFMNAGTPHFRRAGGDVHGFAGTGTFA